MTKPPKGRLIDLSARKPKPHCWLWRGWFELGGFTFVEAPGGVGKTYFCYDIAARVSTGRPMPFETHNRKPSNVLIHYSGEEQIERDIIPKLTVAGADFSRIRVLEGGFKLPSDKEHLAAHLAGWNNAPVRLLIIDAINPFIEGKTNEQEPVREALTSLAEVARKYGTAIIAIRHHGKDASRSMVDRALGSVEFTNVPRCTMTVQFDPDDDEEDRKKKKRIVAIVKANGSYYPKSLRYKHENVDLESDIETEFYADEVIGGARLDWIEECDLTADTLGTGGRRRRVDSGADKSKRATVYQAIEAFEGDSFETCELERYLQETMGLDVSRRTITRALKKKGYEPKEVRDDNGRKAGTVWVRSSEGEPDE